ncbi:glycosyltransferase family 4 protein [Orrella daihaiensis]|uniref:Glycosyltransferase family 4 protein n=1 Tax=Orrella daihaiensis TaxID=2782176 RepID=A0ABY4AJE0_9BURK|nr:glycosyltransferase family 4 protein [Orrella daihaiensis]UOD50401.1 glycosyltransferase family 4 protein [Orrella daihaiensis]
MKILLVHQNFPGQFKHLVPVLLQDPRNQVVAFTMNDYQGPEQLQVVRYQAAKGTGKDVHPWVAETETKVIRGDAAFRAALKLKQDGFEPDLILAHPGWGESLFLKQVWPNTKMVIYCEFYYAAQGSDVGFDPEFASQDPADACRVRMKNVNNLLHFDVADGGISPTEWQRSTFPEPFKSSIDVVHDGINTDVLKPNPDAWLQIGQKKLSRQDEIITFVNRNLEPYRGYHIFMRALPEILKSRPNARVLIVGGDGVSYGAKPPHGKTWKQIFLDEVRNDLDVSRVHFLGQIPYQHFITLLQLSTVHIYLTYPFVLSWSLLEAMSCGCAIVASDTKPLHEAIINEETGVLTPFFDPKQLAQNVTQLLNDPDKRERLGRNAREFAVKHYDLKQVCLPKLMSIIERYR